MTHEVVCRYIVDLALIRHCSNHSTISSLQYHTLTLLPLHTAITLSHPLQDYILAQCSAISRRSSATLNTTLIEQPHYNHSQDEASSPVIALPVVAVAAAHDTQVCLSIIVS